MRYSNLHCHTTYSDGLHTMEENVLAALAQGMGYIGFSDHSYTACDLSYCMKQEVYGAYLAEIAAVKEKYGHKIPIYAGIELDAMSSVDTTGLDYVIASVHYLPRDGKVYPVDEDAQTQLACAEAWFGGDVVAMAQYYYDCLSEYVPKIKPTLVAHFDIIDKFSLMPNQDPAYRRIALEALEKVIAGCPYLELNTGIVARGRATPYPADFLIEAAAQMGARFVLNSDSHHKDKLTFWFDEACRLLKSKTVHCIWEFSPQEFVPVEI